VFLPAFVFGPLVAMYAVAFLADPGSPERFLRPDRDMWKALWLGAIAICGIAAGALAATNLWVWAMRKANASESLIQALMLSGPRF